MGSGDSGPSPCTHCSRDIACLLPKLLAWVGREKSSQLARVRSSHFRTQADSDWGHFQASPVLWCMSGISSNWVSLRILTWRWKRLLGIRVVGRDCFQNPLGPYLAPRHNALGDLLLRTYSVGISYFASSKADSLAIVLSAFLPFRCHSWAIVALPHNSCWVIITVYSFPLSLLLVSPDPGKLI